MIARLAVLATAAVAAAAGAAAWARKRAEQDEALEEEMLDAVTEVRAEPEEPASAATATASASADAGTAGDDLQVIKGIGAVSAERLGSIGVTTYAEIAAWSPEDLERIAARIKVSAERIKREDWVGQAREIGQR